MANKDFVIMGAGEVGRHLARTLSAVGHRVTLIDLDPEKGRIIDEYLDVGFVLGNGAQIPTLKAAGVGDCELFVAASASDEANLAASLLAKRLGCRRTVVRVGTSEDVTTYRTMYESAFEADLLLSTQLLTTTQILNSVLGYNTLEVAYMAGGALQVRRSHVEEGSALNRNSLADLSLPQDSLVLAFISEQGLRVPKGTDRAEAGEDALIVGTTAVINQVERQVSGHAQRVGEVVIAGGGKTARAVAEGLAPQVRTIRIIESNRDRAEELAREYPHYEIVLGDATDVSLLNSEGVGSARAFIALTGHDESNLMACLLAQELKVPKITALVKTTDTSSLWRKVGLIDVVSPRMLAAERIQSYIDGDYDASIISFENGAATFMQRRVDERSPAAGARLADVEIPQGLIVAAVLHGSQVSVPRGSHRLEVGDEVILFVRKSEAGIAQLIFPGPARG